MELWTQIGFIRYPLSFATLLMLLLTAYSSARLLRPIATADRVTKTWIDSVLFWGAFAGVTGVLGTVLGFVIAARSIEVAGSVSSTLVWGGVRVALLSSAVGMLVLGVSALSWFFLQLRWRMLEARDAEEY